MGANLSETPKLYVNGVFTAATYENATGTLTPNSALPTGSHALTYTLTDAAGNESAPSAALTVNVLTAPVFTSALTASLAENTPTTALAYTAQATQIGSSVSYSISGADAGRFTINASTGALSFAASPDFEAPNDAGIDNTYNLTVRATNSAGGFSEQAIAISVSNVNDLALIGGALSRSLTETDAAQTATGLLTITDPDGANEAVFQPLSNIAGTSGLGRFSLTTAGAWTYVMKSAQNQFVAGQSYTDSFTATSADGTTQIVTVTIFGSNDAALIGGVSTATLTETDAVQSASGTLTVSDVDSPSSFIQQAATAGTYGSFSLSTSGAWTYSLTSAQNALVAGQSYTDSFSVAAADGTLQTVTITLIGTNDGAVITGVSSAGLTESNVVQSTTGTLAISDVDSPATFQVESNIAGNNNLGVFSIDAAGVWTYTMNSAHDTLVGGQTYTDSYNAKATDGTLQTITVTLTGTNDAAVITGDTSRALTETNAAQSTSGTLWVSDVDSASTFVAQAGTVGTYGSFSISSAGVWNYTMDSAHNALVAGQVYTDTFTAVTADGTSQVVTLRITGTNDPATITGDTTGTLTETDAVQSTSGSLAISDADSATNFVAQAGTVGSNSYGTFTLAANGAWTYTISSPQNQFVNSQTYTDSFTAVSADGTSNTVIVTITGSNDAPVLSDTSLSLSALSEDVPTPTGAVGNLVGTLMGGISDTDTGALRGMAITGTNTSSGALYYSTDSGATWTLVGAVSTTSALLLASNTSTRLYYKPLADVHGSIADALTFVAWDQTSGNVGSKVSTTSHGGSHAFSSASDTVSISITAVNDAPTNTVPTARTTAEDTAFAITGLSIADVDAGSSTMTVTLSVAQGSVSVLASTGVTVSSNGTASVQLSGTVSAINTILAASNGLTYTPNAHFNGSDTLTLLTSDGTLTDTDTVAITVTAVNDAPTVNVPAAQSTNEDTVKVISGLSIADVDAGSGTMTVNLSVGQGSITVLAGTGVSLATNGTANVQLSGTVSAINTLLATANAVTYLPTAHYNGSDTLNITVNDGGNTGSGSTQSGSGSVALTVNAVNDAPTNTVPAAQSTAEDTAKVIAGLSVADVDAGSGTLTVTLSVAQGTLVVSGGTALIANSGTSTVTLTGTLAQINVTLSSANAVTYMPAVHYNGADTLTMTSQDGGNTGGAAQSSTSTVGLTVTAVNDPPVLATGSTLAYTENASSTAINTVITVNDADNAALASATVRITGGFVIGQDVLSFIPNSGTMGNIAGSYNATSGVMTLTSASSIATLAQWQAALRAVSYNNSSDNPNTAARTVSYLVNDGALNSSAVTSTINVTSVNDAPVVAVAIPDQVAVQGTAFSYTFPAGTFTDAENNALTYTAARGDGTLLPAWITFNPSTRTFSGTPNNTTDFNIRVTASDGTASVSDTFVLGIPPVVNSLAITADTGRQNNFLNANDTVTATVNFSESINVTGTPQLTLNIGGTSVLANYVGGTGTGALTFSYTILEGQADPSGISIGSNALVMNGGTIRDAEGNNATLATVAVNDNASYMVDTANLRTVTPAGMDKNFSLSDDTNGNWVVYTDGTTSGHNYYVDVAGSEALSSVQMRIGTGVWNNGVISGGKAVFHLNNALALGNTTLSFRTTDLAGNVSQVTMQGMEVKNWTDIGNVQTISASTFNVEETTVINARYGNSTAQTFNLSKLAIENFIQSSDTRLWLHGGATGGTSPSTAADTLNLTGDGAVLNLSQLTSSGFTVDKIRGFEFIDMSASGQQALVIDGISAGSFSTSGWFAHPNLLGGYYQLVVSGTSSDTVVLGKGGAFDWTGFVTAGTLVNNNNTNAALNDGKTYKIYRNDSTDQYVLVENPVNVVLWESGINKAPVNLGVTSQTVNINTTTAITGISVQDVDGNLASTQLTVLNGTLGVSLSGGATISSGANNSNNLTLAGTQAQINAALSTLTYTSQANFSGNYNLTVVSRDSGSTVLLDTDTVSITVNIPPVTINTVSTDGVMASSEALVLSGTAAANATVALGINGQMINVTANSSGNWTYDGGTQVRYIMLRKLIGEVNTNGTYSLLELQAFDTSATPVNLAVGKTLSSNQFTQAEMVNLIDGNTFTTIAKNFSQGTDVWIQLDLGGLFSLSSIRAFARNANQEQYDRLIGTNIFVSATDMSNMTMAQQKTSLAVGGSLVDGSGANFIHTFSNPVTSTGVDLPASSFITAQTTVAGVTTNASSNVTVFSLLSTSSSPNDNGHLSDLAANLTLTFNQSVVNGIGNIVLHRADGTTIESFNAATGVGSAGGALTWSGNTLTINPFANLSAATGYYVRVAATAIRDTAGNTFAGIADATVFNFTTSASDGSVVAVANEVQSNTGLSGVTSAGDVNGDGFDDYLVSVGTTNSAYLIYGNATGTPANVSGGAIAASQGFKITTFGVIWASGGGDFNGDGLDDLLVTSSGNTFVIYGSSNPAYAGVNLSSASPSIASSLGYQIAAGGQVVSGAGDVNGDGFVDFITGDASGNVKVIYGAASGVTPSVTGFNITAQSTSNTLAPYSVSGAGDVNGDGFADILVGSFGNNKAFVIYGNSATGQSLNLITGNPASSAGFTISYASGIGENLGWQVSSAGDVNGDGLADFLVAASNSGSGPSSAYVVYGNSTGSNVSITPGSIAASNGFVISGPTGVGFSPFLSSAGDMNGDGLADVIVSDRFGDPGSAYLVYGNASGTAVSVSSGSIAASQGFKVTGSSTGFFATTVSNAGDINGDGLADLIVGGYGTGASYSVILGGTQWVSNAVSGSGTVTGTSAAEAIIGSAAADTLTGAGGVDRLFAGQGNDTIVLTASDVSNLANNTAGGPKALVSGGGGFDTIRLSGSAGLNLSSISNIGAMGLKENSRIESIERIDLGSDAVANTLTLAATDVKDMAGFNLIHTGTV